MILINLYFFISAKITYNNFSCFVKVVKVDITPIARVYSPELEEKLLEIARLDARLDATVPVTIRE